MGNSKSYIRSKIISLRESLTSSEVEAKSRDICARLFSLKQFKEADVVMCYVDFRNEVKTGSIIERSIKEGKKIALPVITGKGAEKKITPYYIKNLESDLVKGNFGILEPDILRAEAARPTDISLAIVPGVAFDLNRHRIGFGKGFYDRFLPELSPDAAKIGLAYELQLVDFIEADEYDIRLDMVITEKRIIGP